MFYLVINLDQNYITFFQGAVVPLFVIEISILPWNPEDPLNGNAVGEMKAYPIHEDETGAVYMRRQASLKQVTITGTFLTLKTKVKL